jgi:predicted DNA-binding transcriptional regulator YafY
LNIELFIAKSARNFIEENSSIIESTAEGDGFRVKLHPIDLDWLARTILGFGSGIEVISPTILAVQVKERAQAIKATYQGSE